MITLKTDVVVTFGDNLKKAAEALGVTFSWLLRDQMRLLCQDMLKITAPSKKVIRASSGSPDWPSDKKIGENAVSYDLNKIFLSIDSRDRLENIKMAGLPATIFRAKSGAVYGIEQGLVSLSGSEMPRHHEKYRSKSTGRVSSAGQRDRKIGRWKFINKMAVTKSSFNRYLHKKQKDVGKLKASWVRPLKIYQQKVGGRASVPGWINKHASVYPATISETMAGQNLVSITVINSANMIRRKIDASALSSAMRTRQKDLNGQVIKRKDRIVAQFNANQQPKPTTTQAA